MVKVRAKEVSISQLKLKWCESFISFLFPNQIRNIHFSTLAPDHQKVIVNHKVSVIVRAHRIHTWRFDSKSSFYCGDRNFSLTQFFIFHVAPTRSSKFSNLAISSFLHPLFSSVVSRGFMNQERASHSCKS